MKISKFRNFENLKISKIQLKFSKLHRKRCRQLPRAREAPERSRDRSTGATMFRPNDVVATSGDFGKIEILEIFDSRNFRKSHFCIRNYLEIRDLLCPCTAPPCWAMGKWARRRAGVRFRATRRSRSIVVATSIDFRKIEFSKIFDLKKNLKISLWSVKNRSKSVFWSDASPKCSGWWHCAAGKSM